MRILTQAMLRKLGHKSDPLSRQLHPKIMFFQDAFLDLICLHFILIFARKSDLLIPFGTRWVQHGAQNLASGAKMLTPKLRGCSQNAVGFSTAFWELPGNCWEVILAPLGRFSAPFWAPADPERIPKSDLFAENQHKIQKNDVQECISKKHDF